MNLYRKLLERNISASQRRLGFGVGNNVDESGERHVLGLLKPPACIFDVGAHQGTFIDLVFRHLTDFYIHAFEPSSRSFKILSERNLPNITLNNFGLSDKSGPSRLYYDSEGSALASLTKRRLDHWNIQFKHSEEVRLETLDDYCLKNNVERIDLVKLDVEGHELEVLEGAGRMLPQVEMVSFEFGGCNIDTRTYFKDFFYFFKQYEMKMFRITPKGLIPVPEYKESDEQFQTTNYLAIRG